MPGMPKKSRKLPPGGFVPPNEAARVSLHEYRLRGAGAKRCEAMLRNLAEEADFQTGEASGAPSWKAAKGQYRERDVSCRRVRYSASTSSSEDTDVVEGPATDARDKPVGTWTRSRR